MSAEASIQRQGTIFRKITYFSRIRNIPRPNFIHSASKILFKVEDSEILLTPPAPEELLPIRSHDFHNGAGKIRRQNRTKAGNRFTAVFFLTLLAAALLKLLLRIGA